MVTDKKAFKHAVLIGLAGMVIFGIVDTSATNIKIEENEEVINYTIDTIYDANIREGTSEVSQEGKNGKKIVTYSITYKYGKEVKREWQSEKIIEPSQNEILVKGTKKYYTCSDGSEYDNSNERDACENKISWTKQRDTKLQQCYADNTKFDCWYDEYPGTTLHWKNYTYNSSQNGARSGAICNDGWHSTATGRGACSHHGGVKYWL